MKQARLKLHSYSWSNHSQFYSPIKNIWLDVTHIKGDLIYVDVDSYYPNSELFCFDMDSVEIREIFIDNEEAIEKLPKW